MSGSPWYLRPGWVAAVAAILLVAFVWWASAGSLPDSPFYNVKLASENISLNLKGSDLTKAQSHIVLADSRLYDLRTMQQENKLSQAEAAFDNYDSHLNSAVQIWDGLTGQAHTDLAKLLYASSVAGNVTFDSFSSEVSRLPATMQERIKDTRSELSSANSETAQVLAAANIDLAGVLSSIDSNIQPLLTAVPAVTAAGGSPTAAAEASATAYTGAAETSTAVASGAGTPVVSASSTAGVVSTIVAISPTELPAASPTLPAPGPPSYTPILTATLPSTASVTVTRTATPTVTRTASPTATETAIVPPSVTFTSTAVPASPTPDQSPVPPLSGSPTTEPHPLPPVTIPPVPPRPTNIPVTTTPGPQENTCNVRISAVSAACQGTNNVRWTATVQNRGQAAVSGRWTATLQIMEQGSFRDVKSVSANANFGLGDTPLGGTLSYALPADTRKVRVQLSVDLGGSGCTVPARRSQNIDPCR